MSLPEAYRRHMTITPDRLVLVGPNESVPLGLMKKGIVFILARWSGQSQLAFRALNKALAQTEGLEDLPLYVADTDGEKTQEFLSQIGETPSGGGETYWVVGGRIRHKLRGYTDKNLSSLLTFTKELAHSVLLANGNGKGGVAMERETEEAS
jgi:hypothetical protein